MQVLVLGTAEPSSDKTKQTWNPPKLCLLSDTSIAMDPGDGGDGGGASNFTS